MEIHPTDHSDQNPPATEATCQIPIPVASFTPQIVHKEQWLATQYCPHCLMPSDILLTQLGMDEENVRRNYDDPQVPRIPPDTCTICLRTMPKYGSIGPPYEVDSCDGCGRPSETPPHPTPIP